MSAQSPAGHLRRFCGQVFESCCWTVETHSDEGPVDFAFLADMGAMAGLPPALLDKIRGAMLAREVFGWIKEELRAVSSSSCFARRRSNRWPGCTRNFASETILFDFDGTILGRALGTPQCIPAISHR